MAEPPIPTLSDLLTSKPGEWFWLTCNNMRCQYSQPTKLAPLIEQYGPDRSSDFLRKTAVCPRCGHRGATLTARSWSVKRDHPPGWQDFPTHYQNGFWSDRPFEKAPVGSEDESRVPDTRAPGPFKFGP